MIYNLCKRMITQKNYQSKEEMQNKLDVFYLGNRITEQEYSELKDLLAAQ